MYSQNDWMENQNDAFNNLKNKFVYMQYLIIIFIETTK